MVNAYTMDFRNGNKSKNHRAEIAGFFTNQKIELAKNCKSEIDETLAQISGVENNIFVRLDVGKDIGNLNNMTALDSSELTNIDVE